jgi:hypothetical protein
MLPTASLPAARSLLFIVAVSYVVSAAILLLVRLRGGAVGAWVIATWLLTGSAGIVLARMLAPGQAAIWWALLVVLGPWMGYSLYYDLRERIWFMAAIDLAGLFAIAWGLLQGRAALAAS